MLLGLFVHEVLFAWTQEEWKNKKTSSLLPNLFSLTSSPFGRFCMSMLPASLSGFFLVYFLAHYTGSLPVINTTASNRLFGEGWLMEAFTAEFWWVSRKSVINVQFWICHPHHSPHFLTVPPTSIGTPWLVSISLSCSSTASQNLISPKHGDFQQWLGLWVCLWEANASSLKYWAYSLESTEKKEGAKEQRYCWLIKELIKVISWVQKMHL